MPRRAATAASIVLAWTLLCPAAVMARTSKTISRHIAARSIIAQPARRSSHEKMSPKATAHVDQKPRTRANSKATAGHPSVRAVADHTSTRTSKRAHTAAQEQALAAQAAIAAADHGVRTRRQDRVEFAPERSRYATLAEVRAARGPRLPADGTQTGDEPISDDVAAMNLPPMKSIEEEAATPLILPSLRVSSLYDSRGRLVVPAPLRGSREILLHQNEMADRDGLDRVRDDNDLLDLRREKKLVALPDNATLRVDYRLPENRRYSRPWTAAFLAVIGRDYFDSFHQALQVDSAVRTVAVQQRLLRTNGNAAPITGETASPHLTGQAVDIAKGGLSRIQIAWMRAYLQPFIDQGKIDVEEEFRQACFHISVYKNFLPTTPPRISVATTRQSEPPP